MHISDTRHPGTDWRLLMGLMFVKYMAGGSELEIAVMNLKTELAKWE